MSHQHASIPVPGVACAGHSVERVLSRLSGVNAAYVNGATEVAEVEFDGERVSVATLCQTIDECGSAQDCRRFEARCRLEAARRRRQPHARLYPRAFMEDTRGASR
jgi:cation transport ATPase